MSQTAAAIWSALPHHSPNDNRNIQMDQPQRAPSAQYINSPFDLADLLNPRDNKRMSLDYSSASPSSNGQHPPYQSQNDFDQALSGLHGGPQGSAHPSHIQTHGFDQGDGMDLSAETSNYEFFSSANAHNAFGARYRTNASSSSSLGQGGFPGLSGEGLYPNSQSPFGDFSAPSQQHPYDLVSGLPSSYSSGKVSPLTPSDPVIGLQGGHGGFSGLPGAPNGVGKDYSSQCVFAFFSFSLLPRAHSLIERLISSSAASPPNTLMISPTAPHLDWAFRLRERLCMALAATAVISMARLRKEMRACPLSYTTGNPSTWCAA